MARIFDVVEYPSEMADEIVHRFPETGVADVWSLCAATSAILFEYSVAAVALVIG